MGLEAINYEASALRQAQVASQAQVKLQKGALEQQGEVVMKLVDSAVSSPAPRSNGRTGQLVDVFA